MNKWICGAAAGLILLLAAGCGSSSAKDPVSAVSAAPSLSGVTPGALSPSAAGFSASPSPSASPGTGDHAGSLDSASPKPGVSPSMVAATPSGATPSPTVGEAGSSPGANTMTVEQVAAPYTARLSKLQDYYKSQFEDLYNQAVAAKRDGQSVKDIYNTFSQKAMALEEDSQAQVNQLLLQLKNELTVDQLPTDSVNELRTSYYAELDQVKASFAEKAKADFGA